MYMSKQMKYQTPVIIPLGDLVQGSGACESGSSAFANGEKCEGGGHAGQKCESGGLANGEKCQTGNSNTGKCEGGGSARH